MALLRNLVRHLREGTLLQRLARGKPLPPLHLRVRWSGADSEAQAALALAAWAGQFLSGRPDGWVLTLGDGGRFHQLLNQTLAQRSLQHRSQGLEEALASAAAPGLRGILCGYADAAGMTRAARALAAHATLSAVPFEYAAGINPERAQFARRDEYAATTFVSPVLLDDPSPYAIYEESLARFEQKCGLRDFLDLYQVLRYVCTSGVPGDIAEFGSYRGHSGWLIARTLQALRSDKHLYMFDMFEQFPQEGAGVDHLWNQSHYVNFDEVRDKLAGFPNVTLVKGDFTQTLAGSGLAQVALAYIDCDSYRATRFLIEALWDKHLAPRAALVCEDYGHPALLGNRAAVHEELDRRPGAFRFFSQFSGLYITLRF